MKHGSWGGSLQEPYQLAAYFLPSLQVLHLTRQEDNLEQWELEKCALLVTEKPRMDQAQVVSISFYSVFSFSWVVIKLCLSSKVSKS